MEPNWVLCDRDYFSTCNQCKSSYKEIFKWKDYLVCKECKDWFFPYDYIEINCNGKNCYKTLDIKNDNIWCKNCHEAYDPMWPSYFFNSKEDYVLYLKIYRGILSLKKEIKKIKDKHFSGFDYYYYSQ